MPKVKKNSASANATFANVGYEAELWQVADALRGSMDAAEYKHVVLGLIFLKYISDAFGEQHAKLVAEQAQGADPEDPDEYRGAAHPVFWVPPEALADAFRRLTRPRRRRVGGAQSRAAGRGVVGSLRFG